MKENKIFAKINQNSKTPAQALIKMIDMVRNNLFTGGKNLDYVKNLIRHQIGRSEVMEAYLAGAENQEERKKKLTILRKRLGEAGISGSV